MAENTHRYVGNHPQEIIVGDKVIMVEPGQILTLTKDDLESNAGLVDDEMIMDLKSLSPAQPKGGENT